jgi:hypothetical protein
VLGLCESQCELIDAGDDGGEKETCSFIGTGRDFGFLLARPVAS